MGKLQAPRGTADLMPEAMSGHRHVMDTARLSAGLFGFAEMSTPIFEFTEVFARPLGASSDVVTKETYSFTDRGGESLTLRPEGTAGVVRALISEGLTQNLPQKFYYQGPMFRYERPQKGRMRQFHQVGVELLGAVSPLADAEVIAAGAMVLERLGVLESCRLHVNSLGDRASRAAYREALVAFLSRIESQLSSDSQRRLASNPLRILDSKDAGDRALLAEAPSLMDYLNAESRRHFDQVAECLEDAGIAFTLDARLVRGLDYYCHTAFEFITDSLGAQGTVLGGGRYDGLAAVLGGADVAGVGWAAGVERLALLAGAGTGLDVPLVLIAVPADGQDGEDSTTETKMFSLANRLRGLGLRVEMPFGGGLGKQLKRADRLGARHVGIFGAEEQARGVLIVRDMQDGSQVDVAFSDADKTAEALYHHIKDAFGVRG